MNKFRRWTIREIAALKQSLPDALRFVEWSVHEAALAQAVQAERERCAKIAEELMPVVRPQEDYELKWITGFDNACDVIATAIREAAPGGEEK